MSYFMHSFILLSLFGGVFSKKLLVHRGELVPLFGHADYKVKEVALYIGEDKNRTHIVTWIIENEFTTTGFTERKYTKIFMDSVGNIKISDVDENYQGKYSINNSSSPDVELILLEEKSVHIGQLVLLFGNVHEPDKEVSLCISGDINDTVIVTWTIENENKKIKAAWMAKNYTKIYMDTNRDIWIDSVDEKYKGKYFIINSLRLGVDLIILGGNPPTESDSSETIYIFTIVGLSIIIISFAVYRFRNIIREKCLRKQNNHDKPDQERLMSPSESAGPSSTRSEQTNSTPPIRHPSHRSSAPNAEVNNRARNRKLQQRSHDINSTGYLPSPTTSEISSRDLTRSKRSSRPAVHSSPRSSPNSSVISSEARTRSQRASNNILPAGHSSPRSSPNSSGMMLYPVKSPVEPTTSVSERQQRA